jgi:predicted ATPase/class 3 adenylate cyclase
MVFTDIEGSTNLARELGAGWPAVLTAHFEVVDLEIRRHGGHVERTVGDAFFALFAVADDAVSAAVEIQRAHARRRWPNGVRELRVRIGVHSGFVERRDVGYLGIEIHRAARVAAVARGGQVLLTRSTRRLLTRDVEVQDLGEYLLKDFPVPERLLHVVIDGRRAEAFGPPRAAPPASTNLPEPPTRTLGRHHEVSAVAGLLRRPETRCVTLTGTGGVGKTRLAVEVARASQSSFEDGARLVSLARVGDPSLVADAVAQQLAVPAEKGDLVGALRRYLSGKELLLVLDNFEHLLGAAAFVGQLWSHCPGLKVLVTSREPLRLTGEHVVRVGPLSSAPAMALFVTHAQTQDAGFTLAAQDAPAVAEICRRLDGLPLAIELAAARTTLLGTRELLDRLGQALTTLAGGTTDAPARQRTLRATLDWSYNLLDESERSAFAGMAVFAGGADLAAAETVTGASLDTLASLVAKNLVERSERGGAARLSLLETVREYAADRLLERGALTGVEARHADYYGDLSERARLGLRGPERRLWAICLDDELDNFRAALTRSLVEGRAQLAVRLAGSLGSDLGWARARPREAKEWLEAALTTTERLPRSLRARACLALSLVLREVGQMEPARKRCQEAVRLYRAAGDLAGAAEATTMLSFVEGSIGHATRAAAAADAGLELARASGDRWVTAFALCGCAAHCLPGLATARNHAQQGMAIAKEIGDQNLLAILKSNTGFRALEEGDLEYARQQTVDAVALHRSLGDDIAGFATSVVNLGLAATLDGRDHEASSELREAVGICFEYGLIRPLSEALQAMAVLACRGADHVRAARLSGAAEATKVEPTSRTEEILRAEARDAAQAVLGEQAWRRERDWGYRLEFAALRTYSLTNADPSGAPVPSPG